MSFEYFDIKSGCPFQPVQCSEVTFQNITPEDGHVYFTTDTKKIYLGKNQEAIQMCGATGFFYGTKEIEPDNSGNTPDPNVTFYFYEIEGDEIPQKDDLILNKDGCFYRVLNVENEEISTLRLTLQGTGTGGSGGTSGGVVTYSITAVGGLNKVYSTTTDTVEIGFIAHYKGDDTDNYISVVECYFKDEETPFYEERDIRRPFNTNHIIDLSSCLDKFSTSKKTVILKVQDKYGEERSISNYSIQLVELVLEDLKSTPDMLYSLNTSLEYICKISGGRTLKNRKITYSLYREGNLTSVIDKSEATSNADEDVTKNIDLSKCSHGTYILKAQASGNIDGGGTVYSNTLTHKVVRFDSSVGSPIFAVSIPEQTEQFTNIPISYLLIEGDASNSYTLDVKLNGENYQTLDIVSKEANSYPLYIEETGKYTLAMTVVELAVSFSTVLEITEYTGDLPFIDTKREDLGLYLNPRGKTNSVVDKDTWLSYDGKHTAILENFYFGDINGWFIDDEDYNYLKLTQGAKLKVPTFKPFEKNAMDSSNHGVTVELDFKISSVLDYDADLIKCISTDRDGVIYAGFRITGNKAYFYTSVKNRDDLAVTLNLVENKRIKISFVVEKNDVQFPMIMTYLDGIASSINKYEKTDRLIDATGDGSTPATIIIDSSQAQIDLYGIRVYSSGLAQSVILNNFQASLGTLAEREKSYKSNLILNANNKVDLRYIEDEDYELEIPYVKLTGGYSSNKEMVMGTSGGEFALPIGKKDYRLVDFELFYPKKGYFAEKGYQNFSEKCTFPSGKGASSLDPAYGEAAITGAMMYAQGTSSLEYPVKNLRIKFKSKKISVRPGMEPVKLVCFKADFMESSGSHNTGAANYIDTVYEMAGMSTPGQDFYADEDIVTCIKGHPVAIFWSPSGEDGTYEYIGKYNLNLDKATPEPFGFKNYPEEYDPDAPVKFGWDENGNNTIRCFEYLDNSVRVCNFLPKEGKTYEETWYELITDENGKTHYGWTEGFESRHPEDLVGEYEADDIYTMASWVNELCTLRYGTKICPVCGTKSIMLNHTTMCGGTNCNTDLSDVEYTDVANEDKAIARFKEEYQCYFNKDYLVGYYLITNVLLMIDSRTKNCMMASWGPQEKTHYGVKQDDAGNWITDESQTFTTNNHIWYPIFYDMDTMLGIDNQGYPRLRYYHEDTDPEIFNGNDVLWNFVRDALGGEIATEYDRFESAATMFTAPTILPYFNDNQANLANEALYNGDADYKYVDTFRKGYTNHLTGEIVEPGKGTRLYAAQGNRSLDREYFITNRINFLRAKYQSNNYQSGDRVEFRMYVPTGESGDTQEEINKIKASIAKVPPNKVFDLTALGYGFAGVKFGQNGRVVNHQFKIGEPLTVALTSDQDSADLESYILGLNNLADIGDLSNKYLKSFIIKSSNKLKRIILGNDFKDYFNPYWGKTGGTDIDVQSCYLLEEINMINCDEYKGSLDFTACKQLKKVLLTNCGVTTINLPEGTVIEELRLPNNIQTFDIKNQTFLTADKFTYGGFTYGEGQEYMFNEDGSLTEGSFYNNDYSSLRYVSVINTPIDSYDIARKANLGEYHFTNVYWTLDEQDEQYCSTKDTALDPSKTYYQYSNGNYVEYTGEVFTSGLYEKIVLVDGDGNIKAIPVLEKLMRTGTRGGINQTEALTGTIYINVEGTADQFELYYTYNRIYPNLKFEYGPLVQGVKAYNIEFFRTDIDNMSDDVNADYSVMTNGTKNLAELTSADGPAGTALFTPVKASTTTQEYDFIGIWVDYLTGEEIHIDNFATYIPTKDMKLSPKFTSRTRYYSIEFYNHNNQLMFTLDNFEYNQNVGTIYAGYPDVWYQYRLDDTLGEDERWTFKGWQTEASFNNPTTQFSLYNLNEVNIVENMKMWTYWEVEDASKVPTDMICFDVVEETHTFLGNSVTGLTLRPKSSYYAFFGGKITIPSTYSGNPIKFVGGFKDASTITHIYFLDGSSYEGLLESAFQGKENLDSQLVAVYNLPSTLKYVGDYAFKECTRLKECTLPNSVQFIGEYGFGCQPTTSTMSIEMNELPTSLVKLGQYAFYRGGQGIKFTTLPSGISVIPQWCFGGCSNIAINQFGGSESSLTTIETNAFYNAGSSAVTTLTFESPLTSVVSANLFKSSTDENYAGSIMTINTHSLFGYESEDEWEAALFGWTTDGGRVNEITTNVTA